MKCNRCGKSNAEVQSTDPYYDEMPELLEDGEENEEEWWCEDCYQERLWDI
jgi:hypothetical protein